MNANCLISFLKNYNRGREKSHSRDGRARRDSEVAAFASPESVGACGLLSLSTDGSALAVRRPFESESVSKLKRHERQSSLKFRPETSGGAFNFEGGLPSHLAAATTHRRAVRQPRADAASTERDSTMEKYLGRFSTYIYAIISIDVV